MNLTEPSKIAAAVVAPGKRILAACPPSGTIKKRFDAIMVQPTGKTRRAFAQRAHMNGLAGMGVRESGLEKKAA